MDPNSAPRIAAILPALLLLAGGYLALLLLLRLGYPWKNRKDIREALAREGEASPDPSPRFRWKPGAPEEFPSPYTLAARICTARDFSVSQTTGDSPGKGAKNHEKIP